jgi:hypothetical protein
MDGPVVPMGGDAFLLAVGGIVGASASRMLWSGRPSRSRSWRSSYTRASARRSQALASTAFSRRERGGWLARSAARGKRPHTRCKRGAARRVAASRPGLRLRRHRQSARRVGGPRAPGSGARDHGATPGPVRPTQHTGRERSQPPQARRGRHHWCAADPSPSWYGDGPHRGAVPQRAAPCACGTAGFLRTRRWARRASWRYSRAWHRARHRATSAGRRSAALNGCQCVATAATTHTAARTTSPAAALLRPVARRSRWRAGPKYGSRSLLVRGRSSGAVRLHGHAPVFREHGAESLQRLP